MKESLASILLIVVITVGAILLLARGLEKKSFIGGWFHQQQVLYTGCE